MKPNQPKIKKQGDLYKRGRAWYSRFYHEGLPRIKSHGADLPPNYVPPFKLVAS